MIIKTLNSIYEVKSVDRHFEITRMKDISEGISKYNAVGQTRVSRHIYVMVGARADFDGWSTSEVISVET